MQDLKRLIRTIPDYPKPGIMFRDITTLLGDGKGFRTAIERMVVTYTNAQVQAVAGIEARGFILGGAVAERLGCGFVAAVGELESGEFLRQSRDIAAKWRQAGVEAKSVVMVETNHFTIVDELARPGSAMVTEIRPQLGAARCRGILSGNCSGWKHDETGRLRMLSDDDGTVATALPAPWQDLARTVEERVAAYRVRRRVEGPSHAPGVGDLASRWPD